jgi:WD40 repeat protein
MESRWCDGADAVDGVWVSASRFCVGGIGGNITMYQHNTADNAELVANAVLPSHQGIKCLTASRSNTTPICAAGHIDGAIMTFDPANLPSSGDFVPNQHAIRWITDAHDSIGPFQAVIDLDSQGWELCSGGTDGTVKVWDVRDLDRPVASMLPAKSVKSIPQCWAVTFGLVGSDKLIFAGYENGDLKVLNITAGKLLWEVNTGFAVSSLFPVLMNFDKLSFRLSV